MSSPSLPRLVTGAALALGICTALAAPARAESVTVGPAPRDGVTAASPVAEAPARLRAIALFVAFGVRPPTVELAIRPHRHVELAASVESESLDRPLAMARAVYPITTGRAWTVALHAGLGAGVARGDDEMSTRAFGRADAGVTLERRGFTVRVSGGVDAYGASERAAFASLGVGVAF